jgi:hypothetical protein
MPDPPLMASLRLGTYPTCHQNGDTTIQYMIRVLCRLYCCILCTNSLTNVYACLLLACDCEAFGSSYLGAEFRGRSVIGPWTSGALAALSGLLIRDALVLYNNHQPPGHTSVGDTVLAYPNTSRLFNELCNTVSSNVVMCRSRTLAYSFEVAYL